MTNEERAAWGLKAIPKGNPDHKDSMCQTSNGLETSAGDTVANILHYIKQQDGDPAMVLRLACMHFEAEDNALLNPEPAHTPNGYDPAWVAAINQVLEDRDSHLRIVDVNVSLWEDYIGPMIDDIEEGAFDGPGVETVPASSPDPDAPKRWDDVHPLKSPTRVNCWACGKSLLLSEATKGGKKYFCDEECLDAQRNAEPEETPEDSPSLEDTMFNHADPRNR